MLERLRSGDRQFFALFAEIGARVTASARLLRRLLAEPARSGDYAAAIETLDREADGMANDLHARLSAVFIAPLDREEICRLSAQLANVIDHIDGLAKRAVSFRVTDVREPAVWLGDVLIGASERLELALARATDATFVFEQCREVISLEEEGDAVLVAGLRELFAGRLDPLEVLRWKDLYDQLDDTLDACAHVARALQRVALRRA